MDVLDKLRALDEAAKAGEPPTTAVLTAKAVSARIQLAALSHLLRPAFEALELCQKVFDMNEVIQGKLDPTCARMVVPAVFAQLEEALK